MCSTDAHYGYAVASYSIFFENKHERAVLFLNGILLRLLLSSAII